MNQRLIFGLLSLVLIVLAVSACGAALPPDQEATATAPSTEPALVPVDGEQATATPAALPNGYPSDPPSTAEPPTRDPTYPGPPTLAPTTDPYPGDAVQIIRPVGIQCEEGSAEGYGDLQESVATVTAAGVEVLDAELTEIMVTTVCGSPTSAHYQLLIAPEDLETALSLGWTQGTAP